MAVTEPLMVQCSSCQMVSSSSQLSFVFLGWDDESSFGFLQSPYCNLFIPCLKCTIALFVELPTCSIWASNCPNQPPLPPPQLPLALCNSPQMHKYARQSEPDCAPVRIRCAARLCAWCSPPPPAVSVEKTDDAQTDLTE